MKFFLISDGEDTAVGMRMAGIEGVVVSGGAAEAAEAVEKAAADPQYSIILITEGIAALCPELIAAHKLNSRLPLFIEIPGEKSAPGSVNRSIMKHVRDAIGLKI